jgi:hypothetical protein
MGTYDIILKSTGPIEEIVGQKDPSQHRELPFRIPRDKKAEEKAMNLASSLLFPTSSRFLSECE